MQANPQADWLMTWREGDGWHTQAKGVAGAALLVGTALSLGQALSPMANN